MKVRHFLLTAAATALTASAAMAADLPQSAAAMAPAAPPSIDGFVSIAGGGAWFSEDPGSDTANGLSIEGAASAEYNVTTTLGFQGDVTYNQQDITFDGDGTARTRAFDGAAHGFYRTSDFLLGGIVQAGTTEFGEVVDGNFIDEAGLDRLYGGVEGQYFLGDLTIYGQAALSRVTFEDETANGALANLELRYFLTPNFKIEGHVSGSRLDSDGNTTNTVGAGASAEYRFDNQPFSIFAKYDFTRDTEEGVTGSEDENRVLVGLKFNLGTDTLKQRDRSGASLKPIEDTGFSGFGG